MLGLFSKLFKSGSPKKLVVSKDTIMGEMLDYDQGIADVLMMNGMHCVGCPSSRGEKLETACIVHGMDCDTVVAQINDYIANKHN